MVFKVGLLALISWVFAGFIPHARAELNPSCLDTTGPNRFDFNRSPLWLGPADGGDERPFDVQARQAALLKDFSDWLAGQGMALHFVALPPVSAFAPPCR